MTLTAPFPWFGGKSRAADDVWRLLGADVTGYVEPFCGSLAVLLARPEPVAVETVNDADGFVANFWRAVSFDADAVAAWADWPVNEVDLEARHAWLVNRSSRLRWSLEDPDFYDAKIAGWWVWGACAWIGSGWCSGEAAHRQRREHRGREPTPSPRQRRAGHQSQTPSPRRRRAGHQSPTPSPRQRRAGRVAAEATGTHPPHTCCMRRLVARRD